MFDALFSLSLTNDLYRCLSKRFGLLDKRFELRRSPFSDDLVRIAFRQNHCLHGQILPLDFQASEESRLASWISVKDENCVPGEIFQNTRLLGAQFGSQKADRAFEARLMQSQNIEVPFDHANGVVRISQSFEAEENPAFIEDGGVGGVYILRLRRPIDSLHAEAYSGTCLIGNGKNYSAHEWAGYSLFLLL